ncbi:MAG: gas vesicle protein GvpN [Candidatus Brocadiales bacterium]|uniref:gas vesicle protein GvpN n=1 Tax=Candidatus Wunengus sp. YC60 TaxID=3367697 RepID=UPI002713D72A|nr:gas vesicle protein GvpN [Candidatus Brocadiales bacterium]
MNTAVIETHQQSHESGVSLEPSNGFAITPHIEEIVESAIAYLQAGYPVHFSGPAGTGKTTLAFHVASRLERPVTLIHGDDEFKTSDLIGKHDGYRKKKLYDNFIHSVVKSEEEMQTIWADNRLTSACRNGHVLIYDEFNRSRPEANNVLLSVLQEGILSAPKRSRYGSGHLEVHPDFRAIFTSNPEEYAGTHKAQDALIDRFVTIQIHHFDRETEIKIVEARSGISREDAETIIDIIRKLRNMGVNNHRPSIRAGIMIARILAHRGGCAAWSDPVFRRICQDVLNTNTIKITRDGKTIMQEKISDIIQKVCDTRHVNNMEKLSFIPETYCGSATGE